MTAHKAARLRSQFLKSYSTIQQVFRQIESDDVSLIPTDYNLNTESGKFYNTFKKYVKVAIDCGEDSLNTKKNLIPCYYADISSTMKPYKTYNGNKDVNYQYFDDGQLVLQDGTLLLFENANSQNYIWIHVDLNGYKNPPNRWGYDLFTFEFLDGELRTMGSPGTTYSNLNTYCNSNNSNGMNGIACAHKAKTQTDYFKWVIKNVK